jgi:hypothetical protein
VAGKVFCSARCEHREPAGLPRDARIAARKALALLCDQGRLTEELYLWADWELTCRNAAPAAVVAELVKQGAITANNAASIVGA